VAAFSAHPAKLTNCKARVQKVLEAFQANHGYKIAVIELQLVSHVGVHKLRTLPVYVSGNNKVSVLSKFVGG
jgi:hypothetical protein